MATISRTAAATRLSVVASALVLFTSLVTAANPYAARAASSITTHSQSHKKRVTCEDVHIFLARGWNEEYPGRQGVLVNAICAGQGTSSCGYEDVIFDDSPSSVYGTAVYQGAVAGISQVTNYATDCPDAKIVLSGYSEGAHVLGDVLAGGGGEWFGSTEDDVTGFASVTTSPGNQSEFFPPLPLHSFRSFFLFFLVVLFSLPPFSLLLLSLFEIDFDPRKPYGRAEES